MTAEQPLFGMATALLCLASLLCGGAHAATQQIWTNAEVHPWATALKCNPANSNTLASTNGVKVGCLDVWGFDASDGAQVNYYECIKKNNQWFNIYKDTVTNAFKFVNVYTGKCLDGWGMGNGQQLRQYNCNSGTATNQKVYLEYIQAVPSCRSDWSSYRLRFGSATSGMCLTQQTDTHTVFKPCLSNKADASQNFFIQDMATAAPNPSPPPPPAGGCTKKYTVKSGDTCYAIWTANGISSDTFYSLNPGINCAALQIGQSVCLGGAPQGCTKTATVKSGDTCYGIWTANGISSDYFYSLNPGIVCTALTVGQTVCIGGGPPVPTPPAPPVAGYPQTIAYWGTNDNEPSLAGACTKGYTVIMIAFLSDWGGYKDVTDPGPLINYKDQVGGDVPVCQAKGIKVILSLGGGSGNYGFNSAGDAEFTATAIWNSYLGGSGARRPFGNAILDGVDFDMEQGNGQYVVNFIDKLNGYYKSSGRKYHFTAVPQCPFPDAAMGSFLQARGYLFTYILVQFYNNPGCDNSQSNVVNSYKTYWAPFVRQFNPAPQLIVTLPASEYASTGSYSTTAGYLPPAVAASTIRACKQIGNLGGFGFWSVKWDLQNNFWSSQVKSYGL